MPEIEIEKLVEARCFTTNEPNVVVLRLVGAAGTTINFELSRDDVARLAEQLRAAAAMLAPSAGRA